MESPHIGCDCAACLAKACIRAGAEVTREALLIEKMQAVALAIASVENAKRQIAAGDRAQEAMPGLLLMQEKTERQLRAFVGAGR